MEWDQARCVDALHALDGVLDVQVVEARSAGLFCCK